jgi:hypothetical protein
VQTIMAGLEPRLPARQKTKLKKSQKSWNHFSHTYP